MTKTIKSRDKYKSTIDFKTIFKFYFYVSRILQMKMIIFCTDSCGAREVLSSRVNKLEAKKLETWEFPVLQLPLLLRRYLVFQETHGKEAAKMLSDKEFSLHRYTISAAPVGALFSKHRHLAERHLASQAFSGSCSPFYYVFWGFHTVRFQRYVF